MTTVDRKNGRIERTEEDGVTILTITLNGIVPATEDDLDRILQTAMIELNVDTEWQDNEPPPPDPDEHPPVIPPLPDVPPEDMPTGEV